MKVQYASDLHLEIYSNKNEISDNPIRPVADVLVLAGDITKMNELHYSDHIFDYFSENWKIVIMIPGNHEYYNNTDYKTIMKPKLNEKIRDNVILVNNDVIKFNDVNFICTTMWSHLKNYDEIMAVTGFLNDFKVIKAKEEYMKYPKPLTSLRFNYLHQDARAFLFDALQEYKGQKNIVVTHHAPTQMVNHPDFKGSPVNAGFVVELYDWIYDFDISHWVYGHTHRNIDVEINGTNVVSNQMGYVGYNETPEYSTCKYFEV
jgi:predicted phosphohydrolase